MICKRCGSKCPHRPEGYCFHCLVAVKMEQAIGMPLAEAGIDEGFPEWKKPTKRDYKEQEQERLL